MKKYTLLLLFNLLSATILVTSSAYAVKHVVSVSNFQFSPPSTTASVGDTMRWVWVSGFHTTTSTIIPIGAAPWDSPITSSNQVFEYKLTVGGTYNYKCSIHASMLGSITVTVPLSATATAAPAIIIVGQSSQLDVAPTGGTGIYTYSWSSNPGGFTSTLKSPVVSPGSTTTYTCQVTSGVQSTSASAMVTVNPVPFITVTSPNGGESYLQGSVQTIAWSDNIAEGVKIDLYRGGIFVLQIVASTPSNGTYLWDVPPAQNPGTDYQVVITSVTNNTLFDISDADFTVSSSVPATLMVQNIIVGNMQSLCYNATQTITVAGSATDFIVQNGGSATMIAGENIIYLPGTLVEPGGSMHGYITTTSQYCTPPAPTISGMPGSETAPSGSSAFICRVYPNPTTGTFILEVTDAPGNGKTDAEIMDMDGRVVMHADISGIGKHELSLQGNSAGIYLLRLISGTMTKTLKIVRQ